MLHNDINMLIGLWAEKKKTNKKTNEKRNVYFCANDILAMMLCLISTSLWAGKEVVDRMGLREEMWESSALTSAGKPSRDERENCGEERTD